MNDIGVLTQGGMDCIPPCMNDIDRIVSDYYWKCNCKINKNDLKSLVFFLSTKYAAKDIGIPYKLSPEINVDMIWHEVLLRPRFYANLCHDIFKVVYPNEVYFPGVVDHNPDAEDDLETVKRKRRRNTQIFMKSLFNNHNALADFTINYHGNDLNDNDDDDEDNNDKEDNNDINENNNEKDNDNNKNDDDNDNNTDVKDNDNNNTDVKDNDNNNTDVKDNDDNNDIDDNDILEELNFIKSNGSNFTINPRTSSITVFQLKRLVDEEGVAPAPPNQQLRLIHMGFELEDDKTLGSYKLQKGSTIHVALRKSKQEDDDDDEISEINILNLNRNKEITTIHPSKASPVVTVLDLKHYVQRVVTVPVCTQRLFFNPNMLDLPKPDQYTDLRLGKRLEDDMTLASYGIKNKSTITLFVHIGGC